MTAAALPSHPVAATVARVREEVRAVARTPVWSMPPAELGEVLVAVTRLAAQVAQLQLRLLAQAERSGVGQDVGATSAANWVAVQTRTTRPAMHRAARLARQLDDAHADVDTALADGLINLDQAHVIVDAVDALPTDLVAADTISNAQAFLLREARDHDAKALRILGRRLLEVLDPAAADAEEARRLEHEEAEARAASSFTMADDGHGRCHGRFTVPSMHGSMLRKALEALANPTRHPDRHPDRREVLTRRRLGHAFMEYVSPAATTPSPPRVAAPRPSWSPWTWSP